MPPVVPAPYILWRQFDRNGDPLAGGKLYSYVAGTSTPHPTYYDPAGTTPQTNPVVLADDGSAPVYLQAGVTYKLVQYDRFDVLQWSADQLAGGGGSSGGSMQEAATLTVLAQGGALQLVAPAACQPGWHLAGCTARVTQTFGNTQGLTSLAIGDAVQFDRWGVCARTAGATTTVPAFRTGVTPLMATPQDLLVTALGGAFDSTGALELDIYYTLVE